MIIYTYLIPVTELGCMEPFETREKTPWLNWCQIKLRNFWSSPSKTNLETWTWTLEKGWIPIRNHHFVPQKNHGNNPAPLWIGVVPTCEGDHQGGLLCHLVDLLSCGDLKHLAIFRTSVDGFWSTINILFNKDQHHNCHVLSNKIQWSSFGTVFFVSWCSWCFMKWVGYLPLWCQLEQDLVHQQHQYSWCCWSLALCLCHESLLDFHQQAN